LTKVYEIWDDIVDPF